MKSRINKFGFEIEGEMSDELMNELVDKNYGSIVSDGSLRPCPWNKTRKCHTAETSLRLNEFVSDPIEYSQKGIRRARDIFKLFNSYFKKKEFHWNDSMGFHLHLSFKPKMPVDVWSLQFVKFFTEGLSEKYKTMYARRKDNTYCKVILDEREIARTHDRYEAVNFRPAYLEHGTIEFRIFPANRPMVMNKYLEYTINTVKYFLKYSSRFCHKVLTFETDEEMERPSENVIETNLDERKKNKRIEQDLLVNKNEITLEK